MNSGEAVANKEETEMSRRTRNRVIIIGSGISGVKAAVDLTQKGVEVVMVEAQNRIGGRLHTYRDSEGRCYDLGASWLHHTLQNELFDFAVQHKLDLYYDDSEMVWYAKGERIPKTTKAHRVVYDIETKIAMEYENLELPDKSLKAATYEFVKSHPLVSDENKVLGPQMVRYLELWHAIPWERISSKYGIPEEQGRDAFVRGGYDGILKLVYEQINRNNFELHLKSEVTNISLKDGIYSVKTLCGAEYQAAYVIVTIPLGALKATYETLFSPNVIPERLGSAIHNSEIAALGKYFFEFDEVFWPKDVDNFAFAGEDVDEMKPGAFPLFFTNGYQIYNRPALVGLSAPPLTQYLESHPEEVYRFYEAAFKSIQVDKTKPLPKMTKMLATDWTTNPYFRGSYSALLVGQDFFDSVLPFIDGAGRLRFAGEHTTIEANGCVDGAYATGRREAEYILADMIGTALPLRHSL
jgi:polyamine oxidase